MKTENAHTFYDINIELFEQENRDVHVTAHTDKYLFGFDKTNNEFVHIERTESGIKENRTELGMSEGYNTWVMDVIRRFLR